MTKSQFKALIEDKFGKDCYKAVCLTERTIQGKIHYEWAIICKITDVVEALICATDTCVYQIKYISSTTPAKTLYELNCELKLNFIK